MTNERSFRREGSLDSASGFLMCKPLPQEIFSTTMYHDRFFLCFDFCFNDSYSKKIPMIIDNSVARQKIQLNSRTLDDQLLELQHGKSFSRWTPLLVNHYHDWLFLCFNLFFSDLYAKKIPMIIDNWVAREKFSLIHRHRMVSFFNFNMV